MNGLTATVMPSTTTETPKSVTLDRTEKIENDDDDVDVDVDVDDDDDDDDDETRRELEMLCSQISIFNI
ncbi:hypothetical protein BLOT_000756 [Blomia tropicalis]|nr:hypothetical protein BLOT_000756 [Blomia tropicalis]